MPKINFDHHAQFFTATILNWKSLSKYDKFKNIVIGSLLFLKNENNNPLQEKWKLAQYPEDYKYSSAKFYATGIDDFGLSTHYMGS